VDIPVEGILAEVGDIREGSDPRDKIPARIAGRSQPMTSLSSTECSTR